MSDEWPLYGQPERVTVNRNDLDVVVVQVQEIMARLDKAEKALARIYDLVNDEVSFHDPTRTLAQIDLLLFDHYRSYRETGG